MWNYSTNRLTLLIHFVGKSIEKPHITISNLSYGYACTYRWYYSIHFFRIGVIDTVALPATQHLPPPASGVCSPDLRFQLGQQRLQQGGIRSALLLGLLLLGLENPFGKFGFGDVDLLLLLLVRLIRR